MLPPHSSFSDNLMKKKIILLIIAILVAKSLLIFADDIKLARNPLPEIKRKLGKISLQLVRTWGDEDAEGHFFKTPADIAIDHNNHVYIVDSALHCINVFDSTGRFIRTIGKRGQGPADLLTPLYIGIDKNNRIWVFEFGNRRVQLFSETGVSLSIFKTAIRVTSSMVFPSSDQIALYDYLGAESGAGIITVLDQNGTLVRKIGMYMSPPEVNLPWRGGTYDSCKISFNNKTHKYYIAYKYSQMIQVFQNTGELTACFFYETPVNKLKFSWKSEKRNYDIIEKKKHYSECVDLDTDDDGRFFIVASTRLPKENERTSMVFYPGGIIAYTPGSKNYPVKTDMFRLMVFGTDGKILAAKQLDVFCEDIYIHKNRIFMIDKTFAQVIYEYQYTIID